MQRRRVVRFNYSDQFFNIKRLKTIVIYHQSRRKCQYVISISGLTDIQTRLDDTSRLNRDIDTAGLMLAEPIG